MKLRKPLFVALTGISLVAFAQTAEYELRIPFEGMRPSMHGALGPVTPDGAFTNVELNRTVLGQMNLRNVGTGPLTIKGLTVEGLQNPAEFQQTNNCGATLLQGHECTVSVSFSPAAVGNRTGRITLLTDSTMEPKTIRTLAGTGILPPPEASLAPVAPASVLQNVVMGSTATATATLANTGISPLVIREVFMRGAAAADYTQTNTCGATVAPGTSCTVVVNFRPTAEGPRPADLVVATNMTQPELIVSLPGTGKLPTAELEGDSPASVPLGQSSQVTAVLTNTSTAPISVQPITAQSVSGTDFSFVSTDCAAQMAAGASCNVLVKFTPTAAVERTGQLVVSTAAGVKELSFKATGLQGVSALSPTSLTFPLSQVGSASTAQTVTVTNNGNTALTVSSLKVNGTTEFTQTSNCASVAAGASCAINVTYTPTQAGNASGTLSFSHDGAGPSTVTLTGSAQVPSATLSTPSFGATPVNGSSTATATLTNTGIGSITVPALTAGAVTGRDFSLVDTTCPATLPAGGTCAVTVKFSPSDTSTATGSLAVATSAGNQTVALSSKGIQGVASVSAASLTYVAQQVGTTSASKTLTLTNTGTNSLTVSKVEVTGSTDFAQTNDCVSVPVNGTCRVNVTFTPTVAGSRTGTIALTHNGSGTTAISLTGTGQAQSASLSAPSFPATAVGSANNATAILTNTGIGPLAVTVPTASSVTGSAYNFVSTTCAASLPANATCTVTVRFTSTSTTTAAGTLTVGTGAGNQVVSLSSTGIQGYATVSPGSLTYAAQQVASTSATQTVTVTNTGTNTLTFTGVGLATGGTDFAQSNNCGSVPVGGTCTVNVTFTPSTTGTRTGSLAFTHDGGGIATVSLTGTGQGQSATFAMPAFSTTQVGSSSVSLATLTNTGIGPLEVTIPTAASVTGSSFSFVSTTCPASLPAGGACNVQVRFSPTSTTAAAGNVTVSTGAGNKAIALAATGVQGTASVNPTSLTFATQQIATTSGAQVVTVTNTGTSSLTFTGIGMSAGAGEFAQSNNCSTLAVNASCTVNVSFTPSAAGTRSGTLAFVHDGAGVSTVSLTGTGQAPSGTLSTPVFTNTPVNGSTTAIATLTNTGSGPLSITANSIAVSGTYFSYNSTTCGASLAAGASCDISVKYQPFAAGSSTGSLAVTTGAGAKSVTLSATGIQGVAAVSSNTLAFPVTQVASTSAAQSLTVTNNGSSTLTFSNVLVTTTANEYRVLDHTCNTLAVGASCTVRVTYTPVDVHSVAGTLSLQHNGTGATSVSLTGTGQAASASLSTPAFSSTAVGSSSTATAVLTNTGVGPLTVTAPTAANVQGTGYSFVSTTCGPTMAAGGTCSVVVRFSPTNTTAATGNLWISTAAGERSVALGSTGIQGYASMSPGSLTFTTQQVATTSGVQTVTVTNTGTNTLTFTGVGIVDNTAEFAQSNNCSSVPVNGTCSVSVAFTPNAAGTRTGNLGFTHNGGGVAVVTLTGTGQAAAATLSTPSFATTQTGSAVQAVATLTNTGIASISVATPSAASVTGTDFSFVSTTCGSTLGAGASCATTVQFLPTVAGQRTGTLAFNTGAGAKSASLAGTGQVPSATLSTPSFPATAVGASNTATATLSNTGIGAISVTVPSSASVTGTGYSFVSTTCGTSLAASGTCTVTVRFSPTSTAATSGSLTVATGAGSQVVNFGSTGIQGYASINPSSMQFTTTQIASTSAVQTVTVTNTGTNTLTFTGVGIVDNTAEFAQSNNCGAVPVNGTCSVSVTFTPNGTGTRTANLGFTHNGGGMAVVSLSGTGQAASATLSTPTFPTTQLYSGNNGVATLTNTGIGPITMDLASATNVTGADFTMGGRTCGTSLAAGASCTYTLTFYPMTAGARTGSFAFNTSAGAKSITLSGTAQAASATLTAPSFPATPVGGSSTANATLTNTGVGWVSLNAVPSSASVSGTGYSFVSTTCTANLTAGASCTVTIRFSPTSTTSSTGSLSISTDAGNKVASFGNTGIQGFASMSPGSLAFAARTVNTTSPVQTVTVTNTGTDTLTFTGVGISVGTAHFAQSNNCAAVPVNGTCTVNVTFTPTAVGPQSGTLAFTHNGGGIATVSLSGTGNSAVASVVNGMYSDGTYAKNCLGYLNGDATHTASPTNGVYSIKPVSTVYSVTCDMSGGGWTRYDFMNGGTAPFPGDNSSSNKYRVGNQAMYQDLASVSLVQKVDISGQSEANYDYYQFLDYNGNVVPGTSRTSGTLARQTIQITISGNWTYALYRTYLTTDVSVDNGGGAWVDSYSYFR